MGGMGTLPCFSGMAWREGTAGTCPPPFSSSPAVALNSQVAPGAPWAPRPRQPTLSPPLWRLCPARLHQPLSPAQLCRKHKVGVLYCKAGQSSEEEMYNNEEAGPAFEEFLSLLGEKVCLKGFTKYAAQLDVKSKWQRGPCGTAGWIMGSPPASAGGSEVAQPLWKTVRSACASPV